MIRHDVMEPLRCIHTQNTTTQERKQQYTVHQPASTAPMNIE